MTHSFLLRGQGRRLTVYTLLFAGLTALLCGGSSASPTVDDTISIGVVLPITGREGKPGAPRLSRTYRPRDRGRGEPG